MFLVVLLAFAFSASADLDEDFNKCMVFLEPSLVRKCCNTPIQNKTSFDADIKECFAIPHNPGSCERAMCFASKRGFATADGTIMKDDLWKILSEKFTDKKLLEAINKKCFTGDFRVYGDPDECDLNKMGYCIRWQYAFSCPDFNNKELCVGMKEIANTCLELEL